MTQHSISKVFLESSQCLYQNTCHNLPVLEISESAVKLMKKVKIPIEIIKAVNPSSRRN